MKILKLPPEEWKILPDLPFLLDGDFEISNHGKVRRISTGKIYKGSLRNNREAWHTINLKVQIHRRRRENISDARKRIYTHLWVYKLFGPPKKDKEVLIHLNGCKEDNYIWNLKAVSRRQLARIVKRNKKQGRYYHKRPRRYFAKKERNPTD